MHQTASFDKNSDIITTYVTKILILPTGLFLAVVVCDRNLRKMFENDPFPVRYAR